MDKLQKSSFLKLHDKEKGPFGKKTFCGHQLVAYPLLGLGQLWLLCSWLRGVWAAVCPVEQHYTTAGRGG